MVVVVNSIYNWTARRMLLFFSLLLDYNRSCLVKRSRALRGRNPTRNNQVRAGEWPAWPWRLTPPGLFFPTFIHLPCHPSENPGVWGRAPASLFRPQILRNSPLRSAAFDSGGVALHVSQEFGVPLREIHYDPTHLVLHGAYEASEARDGVADRRGRSSQRCASSSGAHHHGASHERHAQRRPIDPRRVVYRRG